MVKDIIKCFVCATMGTEKLFSSYQELAKHLYSEHDMKKDPMMDIFVKYKDIKAPPEQ